MTHTTSPAATSLSAALPAAASLLSRVQAQARFEAKMILRNGEQLLITIILPALFMVGLIKSDAISITLDSGINRVDTVVPGILALALMSTAFTSQAIATGFDRRNGVLRLLATTPLGKGGLVSAKVIAVFLVQALQVSVLGGIGLGLGWRPNAAGIPAALVIMVLGTVAFTGLALLLAGTLRAEGVLAVANLLWVVLLVAGGVVLPVDQLPGPMAHTALLLPSGALGEGLRSAFTTATLEPFSVVVLLAWAGALSWGASRLFRWH